MPAEQVYVRRISIKLSVKKTGGPPADRSLTPNRSPNQPPFSRNPILKKPVKRPDFPFSKKCLETALIGEISH